MLGYWNSLKIQFLKILSLPEILYHLDIGIDDKGYMNEWNGSMGHEIYIVFELHCFRDKNFLENNGKLANLTNLEKFGKIIKKIKVGCSYIL